MTIECYRVWRFECSKSRCLALQTGEAASAMKSASCSKLSLRPKKGHAWTHAAYIMRSSRNFEQYKLLSPPNIEYSVVQHVLMTHNIRSIPSDPSNDSTVTMQKAKAGLKKPYDATKKAS